MASPDSFKEVNQIFGAGNNPNTDDLPVSIAVTASTPGVPFIVSKWKLTPAERERIAQTGEVWVAIMGQGMPPVAVMGLHPFNDHDYKAVDRVKKEGE